MITEWRNSGETSRYPFIEGASLTATNGSVLPNEFLVDASIIAPTPGIPVFLSNLLVVGAQALGTIQQGSTVIGTFTFTSDTLAGGTATILDSNGNYKGTVIAGQSGRLIFKNMPIDNTVFANGAAVFEPSTILAIPPNSVSAIQTNNQSYQGKIILVEGRGIQLTKISPSALKVSAIGSTLPLEQCCDNNTPAFSQITLQLPGNQTALILPDKYGNVIVQPSRFSEPSAPTDPRQNLRVTSITNGIQISLASS